MKRANGGYENLRLSSRVVSVLFCCTYVCSLKIILYFDVISCYIIPFNPFQLKMSQFPSLLWITLNWLSIMACIKPTYKGLSQLGTLVSSHMFRGVKFNSHI